MTSPNYSQAYHEIRRNKVKQDVVAKLLNEMISRFIRDEDQSEVAIDCLCYESRYMRQVKRFL
jgi:hypothetical protein